MRLYGWGIAIVTVCFPTVASAAVIDVDPSASAEENFAKIEGAVAGDEVVIAPGTYQFRLYLAGIGTADAPIVIRAADPDDRPVFDYAGDTVENFPGSYEGGDAGRSAWQIEGAYYQLSGLVFRNATDGGTGDSGAVRLKSSSGVRIHDCLFERSDNGLQGAGTETVVEFSEFAENGTPDSSEASHNLYIHGGDITVRYSYIHDARRGQNMHVRANTAVFEYNWIARATTYMADMMPCTIEPCADVQTMLFRGNVFVNGTPENDGQVFVLYNDQGAPNVGYELRLVNNTFIGSADGAALVHLANEDVALNPSQTVILDNNAFHDVSRIVAVDDAGLGNWSVSGTNNWITDGTTDADALANTMSGADPGFRDAAALDFVPADGSALVGAAGPVEGLPDAEYYRDESVAMFWRERASVMDIGAFESTTNSDPIGPYGSSDPGGESSGEGSGTGTTTESSGSAGESGSASGDSGMTSADATTAPDTDAADGSATATNDGDDSGCGCRHRSGHAWTLLLLAAFARKRRLRGA